MQHTQEICMIKSIIIFHAWCYYTLRCNVIYVCVYIRVKHRFQQFFSHIIMVSGCDGELNAHFCSAASLKYHVPGTWHETTPSHIILTLGRPVLVPSEEQLVPFLTTLVWTLYLLSYRNMDHVKRIWYLSPMWAAKVQASLRIRAVSPEPSLLAHTSSESRGTFRQKARSLAPLNGWACAVKMCHDVMLEDKNSLDAAHMIKIHVYYNNIEYPKASILRLIK